jgi:hypothetical protein
MRTTRRQFLQTAIAAGAGLAFAGKMANIHAEEIPAEYRETVQKGLDYLTKSQNKDGSFSMGGQYPTVMTGVSGMALLMEGSTMREGKYKDHIKKAVDYLMSRSQPNGMIGNPNTPGEAGRYTYGHGFGTLFLASVYGEEEEGERRKRLEEILVKAAKFSSDAQTDRGGWGYISAKEGGGFDEGSTTVEQVQALRACRNAGIPVPPKAIEKAQEYLKAASPSEGVIYSLAQGGGGPGSPALTAAGIACGFSTGDYKSPLIKQWFKYLTKSVLLKQALEGARMGHDEYTHYYLGQAMYFIGDKGWKEMFPNDDVKDKNIVTTWTEYRKYKFDNLKRNQSQDGSWSGTQAGNTFATATILCVMQLDNAVLPIYQR